MSRVHEREILSNCFHFDFKLVVEFRLMFKSFDL